MPTVAELIQANNIVPVDIDGISMLPTLLGNSEAKKHHDCLCWEWPAGKGGVLPQAVRYNQWKLVRVSNQEPGQLYNIVDDISESNNVCAEYPEVVAHVNQWLG